MKDSPYDITLHKHRFAAWAASRAASTSSVQRFPVEVGLKILTDCGIMNWIESVDHLPAPEDFDMEHRKLRERIIDLAANETNKEGSKPLAFTHGIAAKLINIYLKAIFTVSDHHNEPRVRAIHPPIDAELLKALKDSSEGADKKFWSKAMNDRWSKYTSDQYERVIQKVKEVMKGQPLWKIEEYWQGYQG